MLMSIRITEADCKKYFVQMSFTGKSVNPPRLLDSSAALKALAASTQE
jgi:hypothetical protein